MVPRETPGRASVPCGLAVTDKFPRTLASPVEGPGTSDAAPEAQDANLIYYLCAAWGGERLIKVFQAGPSECEHLFICRAAECPCRKWRAQQPRAAQTKVSAARRLLLLFAAALCSPWGRRSVTERGLFLFSHAAEEVMSWH